MPTLTLRLEVPDSYDPTKITEFFQAVLSFLNDEESLGIMLLAQKSLKSFLEEEPDVYTEQDIQG